MRTDSSSAREGSNPTSPKVSVIVPVYKVEKYLPECIESVLAQTFTDFELILVDDGSPDNSGKICDDYAARDSRIRVFHKENGGVTSARRLGVENSRAKWIMFVDSDDCIFPKALEVLVVEIRDGVDLIEGSCTRTRPHDDCSTGPGSQTILCEISGLEYAIEVASHKMVWLPGPVAKIIRKSVLISANALDVPAWITFGEDLMMNLKNSLKIRNARRIPDVIYFYRENELGACKTIIRTSEYYCDWLKEAETFLTGRWRRAWLAIARSYFLLMYLKCSDWNSQDCYPQYIVRCLERSIMRSHSVGTRLCLQAASIRNKNLQMVCRKALSMLCEMAHPNT
ncbi:MAG: glycosyltransferase family 2 protein [Opitutales bacterium]|nr:glycosyltransferase family 2 protein [Opitutales bacterium]